MGRRAGAQAVDRYAGADRRSRTPEPVVLSGGPAAVGLAAVTVPVVLALVAHLGGPVALLLLADLLRALAGIGLVAAGACLLLRWRQLGHAPSACVGAGLVGLGAGSPVLLAAPQSLLVQAAGPGPGVAVVGLLAVLLPGVPLLAAVRVPQVDGGLHPVRVAVLLLLTLGAGQLAVLLAHAERAPAASATPDWWPAGLLPAVAWSVLALLYRCRPGALPTGEARHCSYGLLALAASALVGAVPAAGGEPLAAVQAGAAAVLAAVASAVLLGTAVRTLRQTTARIAARDRAVYRSLHSSAAVASGHQERMHDARSTVAGLRCAYSVLQADGGTLPATLREQLQRSLQDELGRLERLLGRTSGDVPQQRQAPPRPVVLDDVLRPLVVTARGRGADVRWAPNGCTTLGEADAVAAVVANLLENARVHAPGAVVHVSVQQAGRRTEVEVRDEGPGVPADERGRIFERGARSPGSPGEGIGLARARASARACGGDLVLRVPGTVGGGRGACFVLDLPSGPATDEVPRSAASRTAVA